MTRGPRLRITYRDGRAPVLVDFPESADPFAILERVFKEYPQEPTAQQRTDGVRDTSLAVYRRLERTGHLGRQEQLILNHFLRHPGKNFTRSEVARDLNLRINSCTARINKLITPPWDVLEECAQKRRCTVTGEVVYQLRPKNT